MSSPPMPRRFTGRVAVVTGAAGGIGGATAQRLAQEGAAVVLVDMSERVKEVAEVIAFLASGRSRHSTGTTIDITGADYVR
jgi:NAD(P)-dependent dehydrogenase (short-subunit alcohol dehydrogenase family)